MAVGTLRWCAAFILLSLSVSARDDRWCSITCNGKPHTACVYNDTVGPDCNGRLFYSALTKEEKEEILLEHNLLRSEIAVGNVTNFPPAADMHELEWDDDLAFVAQRWANQCKDGHDVCRDLESGYVGQNYGTFSLAKLDDLLYLNLRVQHWFHEITEYRHQINGKGLLMYPEDTKGFSQLAWSRTKRVGCGRVVHYSISEEAFIDRTVCNYAPGGNIVGEVLYKEGLPCKQCQCSERFEGLCV